MKSCSNKSDAPGSALDKCKTSERQSLDMQFTYLHKHKVYSILKPNVQTNMLGIFLL